eukprot:6157697-Amphidinium_carterae.3
MTSSDMDESTLRNTDGVENEGANMNEGTNMNQGLGSNMDQGAFVPAEERRGQDGWRQFEDGRLLPPLRVVSLGSALWEIGSRGQDLGAGEE